MFSARTHNMVGGGAAPRWPITDVQETEYLNVADNGVEQALLARCVSKGGIL